MSFDQTGLELGNFLSFVARRQEVIASNVANADTPGYKTRDVQQPSSFSTALDQAGLQISETPGLVTRNDGNNVGMDREARLLAENDLKFNLATQMLKSEFKGIRSAIEEGRA
jgi:flagellar basal-body rod protein FlgB